MNAVARPTHLVPCSCKEHRMVPPLTRTSPARRRRSLGPMPASSTTLERVVVPAARRRTGSHGIAAAASNPRRARSEHVSTEGTQTHDALALPLAALPLGSPSTFFLSPSSLRAETSAPLSWLEKHTTKTPTHCRAAILCPKKTTEESTLRSLRAVVTLVTVSAPNSRWSWKMNTLPMAIVAEKTAICFQIDGCFTTKLATSCNSPVGSTEAKANRPCQKLRLNIRWYEDRSECCLTILFWKGP
mmetsp:Transcript_14960/g.50444  ORF Transcript_14960/g.50444 Transcript_14960/m.50444 type:complete len:244 (+) Transcript_14960:435-1166(+)